VLLSPRTSWKASCSVMRRARLPGRRRANRAVSRLLTRAPFPGRDRENVSPPPGQAPGVIQDKTIERVGGVKTIRIDIRIIAATHIDLQSAIQSGKFRSDLFYRLNVVPIHIPPLRERKDDLVPLVNHFVKKNAAKYQRRACRCLTRRHGCPERL